MVDNCFYIYKCRYFFFIYHGIVDEIIVVDEKNLYTGK